MFRVGRPICLSRKNSITIFTDRSSRISSWECLFWTASYAITMRLQKSFAVWQDVLRVELTYRGGRRNHASFVSLTKTHIEMVQRVSWKGISINPSNIFSPVDWNFHVTLSLRECPSLRTSGLWNVRTYMKPPVFYQAVGGCRVGPVECSNQAVENFDSVGE